MEEWGEGDWGGGGEGWDTVTEEGEQWVRLQHRLEVLTSLCGVVGLSVMSQTPPLPYLRQPPADRVTVQLMNKGVCGGWMVGGGWLVVEWVDGGGWMVVGCGGWLVVVRWVVGWWWGGWFVMVRVGRGNYLAIYAVYVNHLLMQSPMVDVYQWCY